VLHIVIIDNNNFRNN